MNVDAKRDIKNVIAMAVVDGAFADDEKQFVKDLRARLGMGDEEFARAVEEVRAERGKFHLPRDPAEAEAALRVLAEAAAADGVMTQQEQSLLDRLARHVGLDESKVSAMLDEITGVGREREAKAEAMLEEMYHQFAGLDDQARREKLDAVAKLGRAAVVPLLQVLESYRVPDGAPGTIELKILVTEQLGKIGDARATYYLCQQVNISDVDDEITNSALRAAAAEALGKIVGEEFTRDPEGVDAARKWWLAKGHIDYNQLAY